MTLRALFSPDARLQRYLDVEAALALAEGALGVIPADAGERIAAVARLDLLDLDRLAADQETTGHVMMPVVSELARVAGEPADGWVHWGATTQNIQQTADVLGLRTAVDELTARSCRLLDALAALGLRTADTVMAGRTHGQQAVPITFGFKVAAWSDAYLRHLDRLDDLRPRLLRSMTGGAAGTFATLGARGPAVQAEVARRLGLDPMPVPNRGLVDHFAELVSVLALVSATGSGLAEEVSRLMGAEIGEVSEPVPPGDVGSSTMPQKRNAKLSSAATALGAQVRALVPLSLEAMIQAHEVDGSRSVMMDRAVTDACVLVGDQLELLATLVEGLVVFEDRMRANLDLGGGLINAEAVMMRLGEAIGRQEAHEVVHDAVLAVVAGGVTFEDALCSSAAVGAHLGRAEVHALLDPLHHVGLSAEIARETAGRAAAGAAHHRRGEVTRE